METLKIVFFCSVFVSACTGIGSVSAGHLVSEVTGDSHTTVHTCLKQDVFLPVDSLLPPGDSSFTLILIVEWIKDEAVQVVNVSGHFIPLTDLGKRLKYVPEQGVQLTGVREEDLGTYTVRVRFDKKGVVHVYEQTVHLELDEEILGPYQEIHSEVRPDLIFDETTGQWHLQLLCGPFLSNNGTFVTWETPSKRRLASTTSEGGNFVLHVPNPVEDGDYKFFIYTTHCLDRVPYSGSTGSERVNHVEQRLRILEAGYRVLQESSSRGESGLNLPVRPSIPIYLDDMVRDGDYFLAFRLTPGIGKSAYYTYVAKGYHDDEPLMRSSMPAGCLSVNGLLPCDRHYRSKILDLWDHLNVVEVRLVVYKHGRETAYFEFNAKGRDYIGWMRKDTVTKTSYEDFFEEPKNFMSLEGSGYDRKFFINRSYGGCGNDAGWLVVTEARDACSDVWAPPAPYPVVSYIQGNTYQRWASSNVKRADVLAVWVKLA